MKRKKTRAPQADPNELEAVRSALQRLPVPSESFDFRERADTAEEARRLYNWVQENYRLFQWNTDAKEIYYLAREHYSAAIIAAYPLGFDQDLKHLREGDASGMESILSFLEADPVFYGTGYLKEKLARWIKPEMLTASQTTRLRIVILSVVDRRNQRDFGAFCRLARKVDAPELRRELHTRLFAEDFQIRPRARWMLNFLETNNTRKDNPCSQIP